MPHEISRILRAVGAGPWAIEPTKGEEIVNLLALRAQNMPRSWSADDTAPPPQASYATVTGRAGPVHVMRLFGTIMPRATMMSEMSGGTGLTRFQTDFRQAAADDSAAAIVIEVDSPGGMVDQVPETVAMIHAARRADRPIIAVANTMAASAAYWIAAAADELVVTPSGSVGSIGVYVMHDDMSGMLELAGVSRNFVFEGARKVENNPFQPLTEEGRAALQASIRTIYDAFTADVAKARGVPVSVVRADPERAERHFGGGRTYGAKQAVQLGMADRVATLADVIERAGRKTRPRRAAMAQRAAALF
jgi:signal peptide peptidase SppA